MHGMLHARHRNMPRLFEGRSSRMYDFVSRRVLRVFYRRLAADVAAEAPPGGAVLDVGTGPGVLLVELAKRRTDLRLTGVDLSADMVAAATRNLEPFGERQPRRPETSPPCRSRTSRST
jgi:methylase of polypeptide subunit release factors